MLTIGSIKQPEVGVLEPVRKAFADIGQIFVMGGKCGVKFEDDVVEVERSRVWIELCEGRSG